MSNKSDPLERLQTRLIALQRRRNELSFQLVDHQTESITLTPFKIIDIRNEIVFLDEDIQITKDEIEQYKRQFYGGRKTRLRPQRKTRKKRNRII